MRAGDVVTELSKLDPNAHLMAWWVTESYALDYLVEDLIEGGLDVTPSVWARAVSHFDNLDGYEFDEVAAALRYCISKAIDETPIPYALTDKGARSV